MEENIIVSSVNKVHSSCCFLFAILSVLTSPIINLHKTFQNGYPQAQLSTRTKYESVSAWIPWIRKDLFNGFNQSQSAPIAPVWLSVRVSTSWVFPNPLEVVKAYTEQNCTLSALLLIEASSYKDKEINTEHKNRQIELACSLLEIMKCFDKSFFLQYTFLPVIEKENGWKEFDISSEKLPMHERSWWYIALMQSLKSYFENIIEDLSIFLLVIAKKCGDPASLKSWNNVKESFKSFVVCLCEADPLNSLLEDFEISNELTALWCVEKILKSMLNNLAFIPTSLKCFLFSLDSNVKNYLPEIQPFMDSVPLQVLLSGTIHSIKETVLINKLTNNSETLISFALKILSSLLFNSADSNILKNNFSTIINNLFTDIIGSFSELKKHSENMNKNKVQNKEGLDETLDLIVHKLLQSTNGNDIVLYLHKILRHNLNWIQKRLTISSISFSDAVNPNTPSDIFYQDSFADDQKSLSLFQEQKDIVQDSNSFQNKSIHESKKESMDSGCNSEIVRRGSLKIIENNFGGFCNEESLNIDFDASISIPEYNFNPLEVFDVIGDKSFTQIVAEETEISWDTILNHLPILGLTEVNFITLLSHRWDIRKEGPLNEEELKCVDELKNIYKLSTD